MKKDNMVFLKHGTSLFAAFIGLICVEMFLLPMYFFIDDIIFLIGALFLPVLFSVSAIISKMFFILVDVNKTGIAWTLFGKELQFVTWEDIDKVCIEPKMMSMSITLHGERISRNLYFNGGKQRILKVLEFCSDNYIREKLISGLTSAI